ncbi:MBL fold metallo-hydrolase [Neobacillus mesonae]|uniref:MBL fold metallo-hydrolase n=1 Tax=Neobacillus mesonae TaxID=1193713 RepID=UPI000AB4B38F|nr:MBL fold metallo-hydrolase [Neobacillus mesonae]
MSHLQKNGCEVIPIMVPVSSSLKSVNFFLYKKQHSLTLIDAGFDNEDCWNALQTALTAHDLSINDITQILLTHHHVDHVGLVNRILSEHPVPVYAHPLSVPRLKRDDDFMAMRVEFFAKLYKEMGCGEQGEKQTAYLQQALEKNRTKKMDGEIRTVKGNQLLDFDVLYVPGHAPDQIVFYQNDSQWLFGGDLLLQHISSNALVEPDLEGHRMMTLYEHYQSLKRVLGVNADVIFPGHGMLIENHKALIQKRLDGIGRKADKFLALIESGSTTAADVAKTYYKETYIKQFSLVMSEVIGHLDYLELQGKVQKEMVSGVWHYSA